MFNISRIIFWA